MGHNSAYLGGQLQLISGLHFQSHMTFTSIRSRLMIFLLLLIVPVLGGIYWFVERENLRYTDQTINSYLDIGTQVFDFSVTEHKNTLITISNALTRDWGFRNAFGAADPVTIRDAALNLLARSNNAADMMLITDIQGEVIIDTQDQGFSQLPEQWELILDQAVEHPDGFADRILSINDVPYQITVIPLFLPTPVAWIFAGFPLDERFVEQIKQSTASDVSIMHVQSAADSAPVSKVIASSLSPADRSLLRTGLNQEFVGQTQRLRLNTADYGTQVRVLADNSVSGEQILAVIQRSYQENEENLNVLRGRLFDFSLAVVCLSLIAVVLLARGFTSPVLKLATRVARIESGDFGPAGRDEIVRGKDEVARLADSIEQMATGLAEKERVRDLLGKVVSHEIAEELLSKRIELGGEEKPVSILFADIKGFTALSEQLAPTEVLRLLNTCLERFCHAVEQNGGVVDKFMGDALMAIFGAPIGHQQDSLRAVRTLLAIRDEMPAINRVVASSGHQLEVRLGLHTGQVVAGNMGSANRMNYTVIGDGVNLAARLEALTRVYGVISLVSEDTRNSLGEADDLFVWREIDTVRVFGKQQAVRIYEVVASRDECTQAELQALAQYHAALALYRSRQWDAAVDILRELYSVAPDPLYQVYIDRIDQIRHTADADWDAVFVPASK